MMSILKNCFSSTLFTTAVGISVAMLLLTPFVVSALELDNVTDATYDVAVTSAANDDCDDADDRCDPNTRTVDGDITVTKELDKATPASHTNVCDGVTCADGSCAATADECSAATQSVGDPIPDIDITTDQPQTRIREGGRTIEAGTAPERARTEPVDTDGDGFGDPTERAQDYNAARSNKPTSRADDESTDPDDDGDGVPTRAGGGRDATTPLLFDVLRRNQENSGDLDADGRPEVAASMSGFIKFDDINGEVREDPDTGERRLNSVAVAARDLRNWTTVDRAAFTRLREAVASNTPEHVSLRITERVLADDRIEEVEATETETRVRYRSSMKLFGFIPMEREVEARADATGEITIDYPWYRFISRVPDDTTIRTAAKDIWTLISSQSDEVTSPSISEVTTIKEEE